MVDEKKYTIYLLISPNGKTYVGKTSIKLEQRWNNGKGYKDNIDLFQDIEKFGWDSFEKSIIESNCTEEEANQKEKYYIEKYESFSPDKGYNNTTGGDYGYRVSDVAKERQRIARANYLKTPGVHEELSKIQKKSKENIETRQKIGDSLRKYYATEPIEKRQKRIAKQKETFKKHYYASEEMQKKRSETMKKLFEDSKEREKHGIKLRGRKKSEEHKRKMAEAKWIPVVCVETGMVFESYQQAADFAGVSRCCICDVLHGRQKTTGGYHWRYAEG